MKKKVLSIVLLLVILVTNISYIKTFANTQVDLLDTMIDIDEEIYVQHDSNNQDIYLLESQGKETTVYQIINVTYTAKKQWTKDGLYIDDFTEKNCATAPDDYISVNENETYFVRLYGVGDLYTGINGDEWHLTTPIVYFDDNNNVIGDALASTYSNSKTGVEITIPKGATRMYITNYNNQNISIQKKLTLNEEEFNKIKNKQDEILSSLDINYENIENDPILYDEMDKCYITFVNDDSRPDVDKFADLFISKNAPLCLAAVSDNLLNMASNLKETRLEVAKRVQEAGGEILAHNAPVITEDTINDNNFLYNYFVVQKQRLNQMGFNVNGIILAGGNGQITGSPLTARWTNSIYKYSDLLGEEYKNLSGFDSVYFHSRSGLINYHNDIDKIKSDIDKAIENRDWKVFYFHDMTEVTLETLEKIIDYINSKGIDNVEIATYDTVYKKFAKRESVIKNTQKIYYVSSNGTSTDGTDINNPINLQTLNTKKIKSGDTILFKSGDTFFGTIDLSITNMNDKKVIISNYGTGDLPTISTYKYVANNWEKYNDNIYRIDIKDTKNFTGYISDSNHAFNVGFIEDDKGNKYYNKKISIDSLKQQYDFYSDGEQYLYLYIDNNPYTKLGNLKVVVRSNLMNVSSNMKISNIRFAYTGGHAMEGASTNEENIEISNCIIENIGGSYLKSSNLSDETRYGNGIEFYGSNAKDITVTNNIFRNIYDVAFTIQGTSGSGTNIFVHDNVFVSNSQDSEIWESGSATGVRNYQFYNNLSINQGRGWGYEARPDKYVAAHILFWGYNIENTDIYFNNNLVYNPRRLYFIEQTNGTNIFFKENDYIKSNYNTYWMTEEATIFRDTYKVSEKDNFIAEYNKDSNSIFNLIEVDENIVNIANTSNEINEIKKLFGIEEHIEHIGGIATCIKKAVCEVCGKEYGELDANNHSLTTTHKKNEKDATCKETGYTGDVLYDCCNTVKEKGKIIEKLEHQYDDGKITKQATYEQEGEKTYTCKICNETKIEKTPKLIKEEHNEHKGGTATCTKRAICEVCGKEYGELDANNHSLTTTHKKNEKNATCKETGYTGDILYDCCNAEKEKGSIIAKTEHGYNEGTVTKQATYEQEGEKTYTCKICNENKTEIIPKLNEQPNDNKNTDNNNKDTNNERQIDNTQISGKLPQTGEKSKLGLWIAIIILIILAVYSKMKSKTK